MQENIHLVASLDDPRVAAYRNLKDYELARHGKLFIAEGEFVVRRLLASNVGVESVFLAERRVEEIGPLVPAGVPIYVGTAEMLNQVIGFRFHSGIIAAGRRPAAVTLESILQRPQLTLVVCPEIANTENLGSMIRLSAGFGVDAMLLGPQCCDPFFRQAVRVSMGTVFQLPIVQSEDLPGDLARLRAAGVDLLATVLAPDAEELVSAPRKPRMALLFGNEAQGLAEDVVAACQRRITIPMSLGTNSLNVAVAAGIVLYHFTQEVG